MLDFSQTQARALSKKSKRSPKLKALWSLMRKASLGRGFNFENKQAQLQIVKARLERREEGKHISMLAHDLKRPFTSLRVGLKLLSKASQCSEQQRSRIIGEVDRICHLACQRVDGLLSEIMAGKSAQNINLDDVNLLSLLKDSVSEIQSMRIYQPFEVKYFVSSQIFVRVDRSRIQRVFVNLVENAVQSFENRREIWFEVQLQKCGNLEMVVGNYGKIPSSEMLKKMFKPFVTDKVGGTGLGLAIVKKVIEDHGGKIFVKAERDRGTRFYLTLPLVENVISLKEEPAIPVRVNPSESPDLVRLLDATPLTPAGLIFDSIAQVSAQRVIVVEDSFIIRKSWELELGSMSYRGFQSVESFVEWIESDHSCLEDIICVVTDYYFENSSMTGADLVKWMRENYKLPVLLSTEFPSHLPEEFRSLAIGKSALSVEKILQKIGDRQSVVEAVD